MDSTVDKSIQDLLNELLDEKAQLEEYIVNPKDLVINDLGHVQRHWPRTPNPHRVFKVGLSPLNTELRVERDMQTGELLDFYEVECLHANKTAKSSTSLKRAPGPPTESVRGSSTNFPFWPGGMDEPTLDHLTSLLNSECINFETDFETVPPGFERGMDFGAGLAKEEQHEVNWEHITTKKDSINEINIAQLLMDLDGDDSQSFDFNNKKFNALKRETKELITEDASEDEANDVLDEITGIVIPKGFMSIDVLNISTEVDPSEVVGPKAEWAEIINVNKRIDNFDKLIPSMAHKWDFTLDTFQQQAIIHLEQQDSVFVAAHTSAGKTVIAEYAIALSLKHMTRTIYTSPIKALSNQKFRDFRETFKDVGLLTGDIQLFPNSSCLVMTTEILRLMLYNGSDVIRDLEWVIFDEVHYINDTERGVVWEEVLIMLPKHVNIVLLSATVPNTLEFADWIGRTKRKKIYVISTPKRPVPLEHFLYVGNTPKVQNELFKIVTADGKFSVGGYNEAKDASKDKKDKTKHLQRTSFVNPQQDRNILICLVRLLEKKNQLPVILFTFSRKRCDVNASMLSTIDLTTAMEKDKTREFVQKCILRLKGTDRRLQQVVNMQSLLLRGIGVHHSGILPILREVVELLFQQGLVKLLFATETFAMGVNMPAKTVVFDTTRKHDGTENRDLNTAEYIQMAGRAGRRGLDSTGTVIILCKTEVPERWTLENMILGKSVLLESRFRLTYTMILNLLRVEQLRVQDMMKRSFSEVVKQKNNSHYEKRLEQLMDKMAAVTDIDCPTCSADIEEYYQVCLSSVKIRQELMNVAVNHQQASKIMCAGRVLIIADAGQGQTLAVVAKVVKTTSSRGSELVVHALIAQQQASDDNEMVTELQPKNLKSTAVKSKDDILWKRLLYASRATLRSPEGKCQYNIVKCALEDIVLFSKEVLKIDGDRVCSDWDKRQIPRFRNDPPSQTFVTATQQLLMLQNSERELEELDLVQDFGLKELNFMEKRQMLNSLKQRLIGFQCLTCTSFEDHFQAVFSNTKLKDELKNVKHQLSDDSLQLSPDFDARIEVLQQLGYIDNTNTVQLKGRVACEISSHELIITELVFDNVLTNLEPAEIAALLSCMVFQIKNCSEANLNDTLKRGRDSIRKTAKRIAEVQKDCGLREAVGDYVDQFKFDLAEVVFEWARGMSFVKIMELTDVQEGIIVRCIQRLDEILKDVKDAARIVGDPILYKKMEEASHAIKRDIVFAASLYTQ